MTMRSSKFQVPSSKLILAGLLAVLAGCGSPSGGPKGDPELSRLATSARVAFDEGSTAQAARLYARALARARAADDVKEIGNNAYNLAACEIGLGDYAAARVLLAEARREFERLERPTADLLVLEAKAARLAGQAEDALALAEMVRAVSKSRRPDYYGAQAYLLKAELACDRGDAAAARAEFSEALKRVRRAGDKTLEAQAEGVRARVLLLGGDAAGSAAVYDQQAALLKEARRYREMAEAIGRAGQSYADANILLPASDRFYRAARSLFAQGDELAALKMIQKALETGEKTEDRDTVARIAALFEEIRRRVEERASAAQPKSPPAP